MKMWNKTTLLVFSLVSSYVMCHFFLSSSMFATQSSRMHKLSSKSNGNIFENGIDFSFVLKIQKDTRISLSFLWDGCRQTWGPKSTNYTTNKSSCKMQQLDVSAGISMLWLKKYCLIRKTRNPLLNIWYKYMIALNF